VSKTLALLVAILLVVAATALAGSLTDRWGQDVVRRDASRRLTYVPTTVGHWTGEDRPLDPGGLLIAGADGSIHRRFVNQRTGQTVTVLLLCGRSGPMSVHAPDACYRAAGYVEDGARIRFSPREDSNSSFWVRQFQKPILLADRLRVIYGWSEGGEWSAPEHPRLSFAGRTALYKMYLIRELPRNDEPITADPAVDLLRTLLPHLRSAFSAELPAA
jgi:hypothetical protein